MRTVRAVGIATLDPAEAKGFASAHPELGSVTGSYIVALAVGSPVEAARMADVMRVVRDAMIDDAATSEDMLAALAPRRRAATPARVAQLQRNSAVRAALEDEFGLLTSVEVGEVASSAARNAASTASRWRTEGRVFAVTADGRQRFPGFQFDEAGKPHPVIAEVLAELGAKVSAWELALWFTAGNGWLGGLRPVDVLDSEPEQVRQAAANLAAELLR